MQTLVKKLFSIAITLILFGVLIAILFNKFIAANPAIFKMLVGYFQKILAGLKTVFDTVLNCYKTAKP